MSRIPKLLAFLKNEPDDSFTRYAVGLEYAKENRLPEAISTLEDLLVRDPAYVPTYYMLAGYHKETGNLARAKELYQIGMQKAKAANDVHALGELEAALDEFED